MKVNEKATVMQYREVDQELCSGGPGIQQARMLIRKIVAGRRVHDKLTQKEISWLQVRYQRCKYFRIYIQFQNLGTKSIVRVRLQSENTRCIGVALCGTQANGNLEDPLRFRFGVHTTVTFKNWYILICAPSKTFMVFATVTLTSTPLHIQDFY